MGVKKIKGTIVFLLLITDNVSFIKFVIFDLNFFIAKAIIAAITIKNNIIIFCEGIKITSRFNEKMLRTATKQTKPISVILSTRTEAIAFCNPRCFMYADLIKTPTFKGVRNPIIVPMQNILTDSNKEGAFP